MARFLGYVFGDNIDEIVNKYHVNREIVKEHDEVSPEAEKFFRSKLRYFNTILNKPNRTLEEHLMDDRIYLKDGKFYYDYAQNPYGFIDDWGHTTDPNHRKYLVMKPMCSITTLNTTSTRVRDVDWENVTMLHCFMSEDRVMSRYYFPHEDDKSYTGDTKQDYHNALLDYVRSLDPNTRVTLLKFHV